MAYTLHKSQTKTIRCNDPHFYINDGFVRYPRAGFHILPECPHAYRKVIEECVTNGWLKPIAHMTEKELVFIGLSRS